MLCAACQSANEDDALFCEHCGQPLEQGCPACGTPAKAQARFCRKCGQILRQPAAPGQPVPLPPPSSAHAAALHTAALDDTRKRWQRDVPSHLTEKMLASRGRLEGERKQITVLFADLKDSTELIKDLDPEAAQQLLDPAIHRMMDAVHHFEGTVNQVLGAGIMALFGAPIAHEDHALRACYAALAMQTALRDYADDVRRTHGMALRLRVGLNAGEVVVRAIGNDLHMDYSAVGQTVYLAAHVEQLAAPGSVLLTATTLRLVERLVQVNALGMMPVKGLPELVEVCELVGASGVGRCLQAAVAPGLGTLYATTGQREQARADLSTAIALYCAMDMTFWLPQVEAALAQVEG